MQAGLTIHIATYNENIHSLLKKKLSPYFTGKKTNEQRDYNLLEVT